MREKHSISLGCDLIAKVTPQRMFLQLLGLAGVSRIYRTVIAGRASHTKKVFFAKIYYLSPCVSERPDK